MKDIKFIEVMVETHPVEDTYYTLYGKHMFYTKRKYTHNELVEIMTNIKQKYYQDDIDCVTEIDISDLRNQLSKFNIFELIPIERYYFNIERDD